jgi:hypothetical protein
VPAVLTISVPPVVRRRIIDFLSSVVSSLTETVVLDNDLKDCYDGVDDGGASADVKLDLTGTATLPVGATLDFELHMIHPTTGVFTPVPFTISVGASGSTTMEIAGGDHGVTEGCVNFLLYFIARYPNPARKKILLVKAFQICEDCPELDPEPEPEPEPRA